MKYLDLLNTPFKKRDCLAIAEEVNRRLGHPMKHLYEIGTRWQDATLPGDILVSSPDGSGEMTHVSTMIDTKQKLVLSCSERQGSYASKAWGITNLIGVYRAIR